MVIRPAKAVFTVEEAHEYLSISRAEFYRLLASGSIKGFHIGRRRLITKEELLGFIQAKLDDEHGSDHA